MSKGRARKNLTERTHLIKKALTSRHEKLAKSIQEATEGILKLDDLKKLKDELEKPVKLSETLFIQIEDCHPSTGIYKHALPKGYHSNISLINKSIQTQDADPKKIEEKIYSKRREIVEAFNEKPKNGIQKIKDICAANNINPATKEIASFLYKQRRNLDLEAVGDYLSGPDAENQAVLKDFTRQIDLAGQGFTQGLRSFLKTFKLPGEAQKIDRLVESFSEAYCQQNPGGNIADKDAGYILAFQAIMLNTDLHNPSIAANNKMNFNGLKQNLRGCNKGGNFDENFLKELYEDIKDNPFEFNFVRTDPGYAIVSHALNSDSTFNRLDLLLQSPNIRAQDIFPNIGDNITVALNQPKSWLNVFTGYNGTITLLNEKSQLATIQVYNPGFLSKWLFGESPKVIIQPLCQNGKISQEALNLAAKVAASFTSPLTSIRATYDYVKSDLQRAYNQERKLTTPNIEQDQLPQEIIQFLNGDSLKTKILSDFKDSLSDVKSCDTLTEIVNIFIKSDDYVTLKTGGGVTQFFTSSETLATEAVRKIAQLAEARILAEEETNLSPPPPT